MFVRINNTPRDYAWGSTTAIAQLLGHVASGLPEAELWLGTHAGSPARILDPQQVGGFVTLDEWVAHDPGGTLGLETATDHHQLPFLLKLLAAAHPLSLQTHPSIAQAREGFARENAAGVPLTSASRNYKDANHKPELIVALSETFDALCGFRAVPETLHILEGLLGSARSSGKSSRALEAFIAELRLRQQNGDDTSALRWAVTWLLGSQDGVTALVDELTALAVDGSSQSEAVQTVSLLVSEYPGDPGIVVALLLNRVRLTRGEALYLPAGNMHAYLEGLGVELMASSDNVLRGGLTTKHIDVDELVGVTLFTPTPVPYLRPEVRQGGVVAYAPEIDDFELLHVVVDGTASGQPAGVDVQGPAIILCISGDVALSGQQSQTSLRRGEFLFVTPDERRVGISGFGELFVAKKGLGPA